MSLEDKVLVVTGGTRGIGRAIVLGAIEQGARVVFCGRQINREALEVQAEAQARGPGRAHVVAADITRETDVRDLFAITMERFGRVDVAINNAASSRENLLVTMPVEDWDAVMAVNLTGSLLVAQHALRLFLEHGTGGRIVAVGTLAQHGAPGNASYAASKGGLAGLTRAIAKQYADSGIFANMVVTGYVETALSAELPAGAKRVLIEACPMRRTGAPDEIARAVLFLASDRASSLNGQMLYVSGGLRDVPL